MERYSVSAMKQESEEPTGLWGLRKTVTQIKTSPDALSGGQKMGQEEPRNLMKFAVSYPI